MGRLLVYDADEEGTRNSQLSYAITSQHPDTSPQAFSVDDASGNIQAVRILQRREQKLYNLTVRVSDPGAAGPGVAVRLSSVPGPHSLFFCSLLQISAQTAKSSSRSLTSMTRSLCLRRPM